MQLNLLKLDHQYALLKRTFRRLDSSLLSRFQEDLRFSWVFHEHALEGVVLSEEEFSRGVQNDIGKDLCEQKLFDGVYRLYSAIRTVEKERPFHEGPLELSMLKKMHVLVSPSGDNSGRYRKVEGPLGSYMHNSPSPKGISYRMRKLVEYANKETVRYHPIRRAAMIHYQFMQIFPFDKTTGHAGRLLLNSLILAEGYPLVVLPASVRADYYNALCAQGPGVLTELVVEALFATIRGALGAFEGENQQRASAA